MYPEDAPTQRAWHTSVGLVDFARASAALQHVESNGTEPDQFRVLFAVCNAALRHERVVLTNHGAFDMLSAARVLTRLRDGLQPEDVTAVRELLFVIFERSAP